MFVYDIYKVEIAISLVMCSRPYMDHVLGEYYSWGDMVSKMQGQQRGGNLQMGYGTDV